MQRLRYNLDFFTGCILKHRENFDSKTQLHTIYQLELNKC